MSGAHQHRPRWGLDMRSIPPDNDIHGVRTTTPTPSVSLHLLASDIGCTRHHTYDPEKGTVRPFRSGYTNAECEDESNRPGPS